MIEFQGELTKTYFTSDNAYSRVKGMSGVSWTRHHDRETAEAAYDYAWYKSKVRAL
jgi:hypothetical protein